MMRFRRRLGRQMVPREKGTGKPKPGENRKPLGSLKRHKSDAVLVWHTTAPPNNHFSSNIGSGVSILKPWRVSSSSLF